MEVTREEQYSAIKFCFRLNHTATETYEKLKQAYGEDALPRATVFRWFKDFKEGRLVCVKQGGPGVSASAVTEVNINTAAVIVREDRRITLRNLSEVLRISYGSVFTIMHDHLHMTRVCARWVPRLLTPEQKVVRMETSHEVLRLFADGGDAFLKSIITGDESWLHHYDPEGKQASTVWKSPGSPTPKKAKVVPSAGKVMVITFFDCNGMIYQHAVPPHTTVTAAYYTSVLATLRKHIAKKRPELSRTGWRLHHDNARPHVANQVMQFLARFNITCVPHPPYSPDLAPCDFFLFPSLKAKLRGIRFENSEAVLKKSEAILKDLTKNGLQHVFKDWQRRYKKCIEVGGDYFEKDHVNIEME